MLLKKFVVSLMFGIGAAAPAVALAFKDDGFISGEEWGGILGALAIAFWGKFSSNTTVFAPSREGETIAGPPKS